MTTSQWWVNVAVISQTLNERLHMQILQQKPIPVTNHFLPPTTFLSGRSKVDGDRIYCTIKQNVRFRGMMHTEIEFKMTVNEPLFTSIGLISGKPCQIGRPLLGY